MIILGICDSPTVLDVVRIVKLIIDIIKVIVPIALIISLVVAYMDAVKEGDPGKVLKTIPSRAIAVFAIFLAPTIITVVINLVAPSSDLAFCLEMSNTESIVELRHDYAIDAIHEAESNPTLDNYNSALSKINELDDYELKKELSERLDAVKKTIDSNSKKVEEEKNTNTNNNTPKNNALANTIFMGDSRTVGMQSVTNQSTEITIAKSGGTYYDFIKHAQTAKDNYLSGKSYNIVLNYGVNDLYNISKYCDGYNDFISSIGSNHKIFIESVNPLGRDNSRVESFNSSIKSCVSGSNVYYCDVYGSIPYSSWSNGYISSDKIHYTKSGYQYIYNQVKNCISSH